jgi:hypothetical protein
MAKISKSGEEKYAILVNEKKLRELEFYLGKEFADIGYCGITKDKTNLKFDSLDDVLSYPNYPDRRLLELSISCYAGIKDEDSSLRIILGNDSNILSRSVTYYFDYSDLDWGFRFEDDFRKYMHDFKKWYSPISKYNMISSLLLLTAITFISISGYFWVIKALNGEGFIAHPATETSYIPILIFYGLVIGTGYLLEKVKSYLFPKSFIALGRQVEEYKKRQKIGAVLFSVILIPTIVGLFVNYIS